MKKDQIFDSTFSKREDGEGESIINFSTKIDNQQALETQKSCDEIIVVGDVPQEEIDNDSQELAFSLGVEVVSFNKCVEEASKLKDPENLYCGLMYEGELTALYADTNLGKSIFAIQMGEAIAEKGFKTLYVDIEMSAKGVEMRSRREDGTLHRFPTNFYRMTINFSQILKQEALDDDGFGIIDRIEAIVKKENFKVVILDNLTALCSAMEKGETAVKLTNRLIQMRNDCQISILFLCHTPKLDRTQPLTRDSMGGSKRIISLVDSAFAIGQSVHDPLTRYVKQTKVRVNEFKYHENNVMVCRIERCDGVLRFFSSGCAREAQLLEKNDKTLRNQEVVKAVISGLSFSQVAKQFGISKTQVYNIYSEYKKNNEDTSVRSVLETE